MVDPTISGVITTGRMPMRSLDLIRLFIAGESFAIP
ncbi:hypothetical protein [Escherichia phage ZCEC13]|uniref:Uncharacterized protein n=1 Tax=Escherichia phage ZCEC13 TaxID=2935866 RepID=A0AAE9HG23_9CAUD|nr:hypothetical protein [Escherichia phage ZCEC13]